MGNLLMEAFFWLYIFLDKRKSVIITIGFVGTFIWGLWVYIALYDLSFDKAFSYALGLFAVDPKTPDEIGNAFKNYDTTLVKSTTDWMQVYTVSIVAKVVVLLTVLLIYIREILSFVYKTFVRRRGNHSIVVGLGRNSRFFINSMLEKKDHQHKIMAFEIDKENEYLDIYKNKKISIVMGDVEKVLDSLNLENCDNVFISTGSDEKNIYYALKFLEKLKGNDKIQKLLVHIEDRTLRNFYSDEGALNNCGVDLKVFSFYKESARMFFQKYSLDENSFEVIDNKNNTNDIEMHIIGDDDLSIAMVVEACKLAHFPDENKLIINCIAKDTTALKEKINYSFPEMKHIPSVKINYENLDSETELFYREKIWSESKVKNLKHVFYCYDDIMKNIKIATKVKDKTFLRRREEGKKIHFHIATMNHKKIANEIELTPQGNVSVFARAEEVCSYDNLLNNDVDKIAKMINYDYFIASEGRDYSETQKAEINNADELWKVTLINDKKSSIGQAIHLKSKLSFLGLTLNKNTNLDEESLIAENKKMIYKVLGIKNVANLNFSEEGATFLDKLAIVEHNRWMALLMIMDYKCSENGVKDKAQKLHPLLKPLNEFTEEEIMKYVPYDVNAILEIAIYEAKARHAICLKPKKKV